MIDSGVGELLQPGGLFNDTELNQSSLTDATKDQLRKSELDLPG